MITTIERPEIIEVRNERSEWRFEEKINIPAQPQKFLRGQVWEANLGDGVGSEQKFKRPVLIIQNDKGNKYSPTVTIIPLTSKPKNNLPTHVYLNDSFLSETSTVIIEQIRTIDKTRLIKILGKISEVTMNLIEIAVDIQVKEFDYLQAYELYKQIVNINSAIKKCGRIPELLKTYNYFIDDFKNYCNKYMKDYIFVLEEIKNNYNYNNVNLKLVN